MNTQIQISDQSISTHTANHHQPITRIECLESERLDFLPHYFGDACVAFENRRLCRIKKHRLILV